MSSQARQLCYPRSNFSVISSPHQGGLRGSLGLHFCSGSHLINAPVRLTFAFALYSGFLTHLSQPLGPVDIKYDIGELISKISDFRYLFDGVPPQPNCPSIAVLFSELAAYFSKSGVSLASTLNLAAKL